MDNKLRLLVDKETGHATSAQQGGEKVRIRKRPLPDKVLSTIRKCLELGHIPNWAQLLGFESVTAVDSHWSVVLSVMAPSEFAPILTEIDDETTREKLFEAHGEFWIWLSIGDPRKAKTGAERAALYRERMRLGKRKFIQVKARENHEHLIRQIARALFHDSSDRTEKKLQKAMGLKQTNS